MFGDKGDAGIEGGAIPAPEGVGDDVTSVVCEGEEGGGVSEGFTFFLGMILVKL